MKPNKNNELIKNAIQVWTLENYTFALVTNEGDAYKYMVKVFPHDDKEPFWLWDDSWETESGATWAILSFASTWKK